MEDIEIIAERYVAEKGDVVCAYTLERLEDPLRPTLRFAEDAERVSCRQTLAAIRVTDDEGYEVLYPSGDIATTKETPEKALRAAGDVIASQIPIEKARREKERLAEMDREDRYEDLKAHARRRDCPQDVHAYTFIDRMAR